MKFQKQLNHHRPADGIFGDCHRTAIACLLDLEPEQVPNFGLHIDDTVAFHAECEAFLRSRGLATVSTIFSCSLEDLLAHQGAMNAGAYYLLGGTSRTGVGHTVVGKGGAIVWDPSITDAGIVGPMSDGYYWITYLVPASLVDMPEQAREAA